MENKIYFLGETKDFYLAQQLYDLVREDFDINARVAVLQKGCEAPCDIDVVVCEFGEDVKTSAKICTYSVGQSNADICGFNFMKREKSRSLDLFSMSFMGRVNLPVESQFSEASVLYCAAGLVAAGNALPKVLKAINAKIS